MKSILIFICLFYLCRCGTEEDFQKLDSIKDEGPCVAAGGGCTFADDCPESMVELERGLCPEQQPLGVECCYALSVKETRCLKRGGICVDHDAFCAEPAVYKEATDCEKWEKCCVQL